MVALSKLASYDRRQPSRFWYHGDVAIRTSFVLLLGLASCSAAPTATTQWMPGSAPDLGPVVARVEGVPIFAKQVLAEAKRSGQSIRAALATLVDANAAAETVRGLGRDLDAGKAPDVTAAMVERLLDRELEPTLTADAIPEATLRPVYERVRDNYVHPRLVEIAVLAIFTGETMDNEVRKNRGDIAKELEAFLARHPVNGLDQFEAVAKDKEWSSRGVSYRRVVQGLDRPLSKTIGVAVAKLRASGDTTPLLTDVNGFYIARYVGEQPPQDVPFEQARAEVAAAYLDRWRSERFMSFTGALLRTHKVEAYFDRLTTDEKGR
jgi:hypothetical protein